jgi:solute carrier family 6 (neurotransmitter transporter, GABA) member 1
MIYFRHSFTSPLPWAGRPQEFYEEVVGINPVPTPGNYTSDGTGIVDWVQYNGTRIMPETVGWTIFTWFLVWISIFKGTGLTGRVVYFTMGLPVVITIILIGRSCSLPNAVDGVKLYFATWRGEELAKGAIWQTACGQVFFSTGVGFGYFTSYASYNKKHSNAVLDSILVVSSNVLFENIAAFAVFGVVGFLGMYPDPANPIGGFTVGFLTLPEAVVSMPASNFWAVMLFFTLMTLGYSSAFAMLDAVVTLIMDAWPRLNRTIVVTSAVVLSFLLSLPYCTEFGYYLLSGIDRWTNDIALVFVVWSECVCATVVYRWHDVAAQVGKPAWITYTATYFASQVLGCVVAQTVNAPAGAGVGFGIYIVGSTVTVLISKNPQEPAPSFWGKNHLISRFWYVALYSVSKALCPLACRRFQTRSFLASYPNRIMQGNQLCRDLNQIVGSGGNWRIPSFWAPMLRYIAAPALAIVYSFSYGAFYKLRNDPLHVMGFGVGHIALLLIAVGFIVPKWYDTFIPPERRGEGKTIYGVNVPADAEVTANISDIESSGERVIDDEKKAEDSSDLAKSSSPDAGVIPAGDVERRDQRGDAIAATQ